MKFTVSIIGAVIFTLNAAAHPEASQNRESEPPTNQKSVVTGHPSGQAGIFDAYISDRDSTILPGTVAIVKELLYDRYTLADEYPYKDTTRRFQWDKIEHKLAYVDRLNAEQPRWGVVQNKRDVNGPAPRVGRGSVNDYKEPIDAYGVERYQSIPFYTPGDSIKPERYGRDGSLIKIIEQGEAFARVDNVNFDGEWLVPVKYLKPITTENFYKVVVVDRKNQNICTLEKSGDAWLVRSMNPATTGRHQPPYQHETPLGIFVVQEKKPRMPYLKDGSSEMSGFAPYASRFTDGAYIHGIPVNLPHTELVEFSATLGTTPRSHMCVRNATSHAKYVYEWAPVAEALVIVIE
ncbi:L,D-transpeptidase [uncultured Alistipes sp.]|jgi:hypothetical protein bfra3_12355|uniref:L,D-transpeptidase n=1 Tax=uncultured Alistipes sp. TaxID=538949 RepID=UPI0025D1C9CB|nr:L,D-transpeptidase [uncultured Alistipes sp.]